MGSNVPPAIGEFDGGSSVYIRAFACCIPSTLCDRHAEMVVRAYASYHERRAVRRLVAETEAALADAATPISA